MKSGDLVNFYSTVESFQRDYHVRNPGLVISYKEASPTATKMSWDRASACVLWSDGSMTREHASYLQVVENSNEV